MQLEKELYVHEKLGKIRARDNIRLGVMLSFDSAGVPGFCLEP